MTLCTLLHSTTCMHVCCMVQFFSWNFFRQSLKFWEGEGSSPSLDWTTVVRMILPLRLQWFRENLEAWGACPRFPETMFYASPPASPQTQILDSSASTGVLWLSVDGCLSISAGASRDVLWLGSTGRGTGRYCFCYLTQMYNHYTWYIP